MKDNDLDKLPVGALLVQVDGAPKYKFLIPSYQRGYRWENDQVENLLDDLYEFICNTDSKKQKYCLQPVVVKKLPSGSYEVLDGQQRLTTIYILLRRLKKNINDIDLFSLEYATRPDSAAFLDGEMDKGINDQNPDYYYMSKAYARIDKWLQDTKAINVSIANELYINLAQSVEFIWYEIINDVDAIDVFTRINIGKIPLTNADLVKAVFLSKNNLSLGYVSNEDKDGDFARFLSLKQNAIALEWDAIEKALQDPKVWGFVYEGDEAFETRIDFLLNLTSKKPRSEKNVLYSFNYFYDRVKEVRADKKRLANYSNTNTSFIDEQWAILKGNFDVLMEWYNNKTYNHLIGFLIRTGYDIGELILEFKSCNRKAFITLLKSKIKSILAFDSISDLRYGKSKDNDKLERILLLHNVLKSLTSDGSNIQYPFERMERKHWSLEHIFAQNSDELRQEDYAVWLRDHYSFLLSRGDERAEALAAEIAPVLPENNGKIEKDDFQELFNKISRYIQDVIQKIDGDLGAAEVEDDEVEEAEEYEWISEDHSIANLALLDSRVNSAIKNSLFDIKRNLILKKDRDGLFIPNETKKVFLKYYTPSPSHLAYWTYADRKAYVEDIQSTLKLLDQ